MKTAIIILIIAVLILSLVFSALRIRFQQQIEALQARVLKPETLATINLIDIPENLRAYAEVNHQSIPADVVGLRIHQQGEIMLAAGKPWCSFQAEQIISLQKPAFVWFAKVSLMPGITIWVIDAFDGTEGLLTVRIAGVLPLANLQGPAVSVAQAQRYIAELPWAPGALLRNARLQYHKLPDGAVRISIHTGEQTASVDIKPDNAGHPSSIFTTARARTIGSEIIPTPWGGEFTDWSDEFDMLMPRRGEVAWYPDSRLLPYFRGEIISVTTLTGSADISE